MIILLLYVDCLFRHGLLLLCTETHSLTVFFPQCLLFLFHTLMFVFLHIIYAHTHSDLTLDLSLSIQVSYQYSVCFTETYPCLFRQPHMLTTFPAHTYPVMYPDVNLIPTPL